MADSFFDSIFDLFPCSNMYNCFETMLVGILSVLILYFFAMGFKDIVTSKVQYLKDYEKTIYYCAFAFTVLFVFVNLVYSAPFLKVTVKVASLVLNIIVCAGVAKIFFPEERQRLITKLMFVSFLGVAFIWYLCFPVMRFEKPQDECSSDGILLLSKTGMGVSALACVFGGLVIRKHFKQEKAAKISAKADDTELEDNAHTNLRDPTLVYKPSYIIMLMAACVLAYGLQLGWDLKDYTPNQDAWKCILKKVALKWSEIVVYALARVACQLLIPLAVYFFYSWRNSDLSMMDASNRMINRREGDSVSVDININ